MLVHSGWRRSGCASALLATAAACEPATTVTGVNKLPDYNRDIKRLFVYEAVGPALGKQAPVFQQAFAKALSDCGIANDSSMRNALALDDDAKGLTKRIAKFNPDAILRIDEESHTYAVKSGANVKINYVLTLTDLQMKRQVWKETMTFFPRSEFSVSAPQQADPGVNQLASEILGYMARDGVLRACPAAQR